MGVYNIYGHMNIQLKVGDCCLHHYSIADICDIEDGIYLGYEGIIVVQSGMFIAEYGATPVNFVAVGKKYPNALIYDKWGTIISGFNDLEKNNPIRKVLKDLGYE